MPNTPALVQCGASVFVPGSHATKDDVILTEKLLLSVGTAERVPEELMDPITALSGSGPAYVSLILIYIRVYAIFFTQENFVKMQKYNFYK